MWLHLPCMRLGKRMKQDLARPYLPFRRLLSCASAHAAAPSACAKSTQPMPACVRAPPAQELAACARKGSFRSMRPEKPSHAAAAARSARPASTAAATSAPCSTAPPAYPRCSSIRAHCATLFQACRAHSLSAHAAQACSVSCTLPACRHQPVHPWTPARKFVCCPLRHKNRIQGGCISGQSCRPDPCRAHLIGELREGRRQGRGGRQDADALQLCAA